MAHSSTKIKDSSLIEREYHEYKFGRYGVKRPAALLLDSSLISQTPTIKYNLKLIKCGDYYHIYKYSSHHEKKLEKMKDSNLTTDVLINKTVNMKGREVVTKIEEKNIIRSKISLQRLVKCNEAEFKTFITLTFKDNVVDISEANKKFNSWRTRMKRIKKDFKYICVPEFQKRGSVHYHLLTNIDINEINLIIPQNGKTTMYDVYGWIHGFSSVFPLRDINIVGYISKYMTKDIDNRLFGKRRYLYSQNLTSPTTSFLNLDRVDDFIKYIDLFDNSMTENYTNEYHDVFNNLIKFSEFKKVCD